VFGGWDLIAMGERNGAKVPGIGFSHPSIIKLQLCNERI